MRAGTGFGLNPTRLKGRGGRKLIITPEGATAAARKRSRDDTLMKALIHRHRWQRKIDSGQARSSTDIAAQENVTDADVWWIT
jgi:hypothetical protein